MDVAIAGGHGKVALRLALVLSQRGDRVRSLVRNPDHREDVEAAGGEFVAFDLERQDEHELARAIEGADAVVFAAGAGAGSGAERKRTMDYGGAVKLIEAAQQQRIGRYLMISSIGAQDPASGGAAMGAYLEAKAEADAYVTARADLDWTIVRPGHLTDEPGTGLVTASRELGGRGPVPRDDVAAVLAACLTTPATIGVTFELFAGSTPIDEALRF